MKGMLREGAFVVTHGAADLRIANHPDLFSDGYCSQCVAPIGARTDEPLTVSYATGRHWRFHAGMGAIPTSMLPHSIHGPVVALFSAAAVDWFSVLAPDVLTFRPVRIVGEHAHPLFELAGSRRHLSFARLVADHLDDSPSYRAGHCHACGWRPSPVYAGSPSLPERVVAVGSDATRFLTQYFLRESDVADMDVPFWTAGPMYRSEMGIIWRTKQWKGHVRLKQPTSGMNPRLVGIVDDAWAIPP